MMSGLINPMLHGFRNTVFLSFAIFFFVLFFSSHSRASEDITVIYLGQVRPTPPALSNLDPVPDEEGLQGVRLGLVDNNTTGQFLNQHYQVVEVTVPIDADPLAAFRDLVADGHTFFIVDLEARQLDRIIKAPESKDRIVMDIATRDDQFRQKQCGDSLFHLRPSRAMLADALGQYSLKKRWNKWFLVVGPNEEDKLYGAALKRAAKRMRIKIVEEKVWDHTHDARRTAQSEVPVFTQGVDYDFLVVADESGMFGEYLIYRTWQPRLVAGTQGLTPTSWHRTHEQWGAVQLQNRFYEQSSRGMTERDYAGWLAMRALGEAITRSNSREFIPVKNYMRSDKFSLAGFKGVPLSFRSWNGQLRQPVLLAAARSMVSVAPLEGFLHPSNELDSLGFDKPEVSCK